jgi:DNA polymerase-1
MISVDDWLQNSDLRSVMIMQVHDELVLEVPEDELQVVSEGLMQRMESAARLKVPLLVDVGVGDNWDEAH